MNWAQKDWCINWVWFISSPWGGHFDNLRCHCWQDSPFSPLTQTTRKPIVSNLLMGHWRTCPRNQRTNIPRDRAALFWDGIWESLWNFDSLNVSLGQNLSKDSSNYLHENHQEAWSNADLWSHLGLLYWIVGTSIFNKLSWFSLCSVRITPLS